ncbi:hypothetical protein [Natronorubrum halophilum]|uniref:hypothetical protein n=1 Tax=Natronorubrum halophilum TaxID=1702106 RepID=UPI0010C1C2E8|nr:hypothetical protein [Natronorubrum halophilum]
MSADTTSGAVPTESPTDEDAEWGKIGLAVLISIVLATGAHYLLLANLDTHPSLHALVGILLFFVTGFVVFQLVMG